MTDEVWLARVNSCKVLFEKKQPKMSRKEKLLAKKLYKYKAMIKTETQVKKTYSKNKFIKLLCSEKFHISLIIPTILGIFIPLIEVKEYVVCFSFLMGVSTQPLIKTIGEIYKKNESNGN
jgi:hypothetical protein